MGGCMSSGDPGVVRDNEFDVVDGKINRSSSLTSRSSSQISNESLSHLLSPRSTARDVRHWKRCDESCRAVSRPGCRPPARAARPAPGKRRVSFDMTLDVVHIPPLSDISRSIRSDVYWTGNEFDQMHRQRQRLALGVARAEIAAGPGVPVQAPMVAGESLRGLGIVDERHLGTIAQRQQRIRDRGRAVVAAQHDASFSDAKLAVLAECLSRDDLINAAKLARRDHEEVADVHHETGNGRPPRPPRPPVLPSPRNAPPTKTWAPKPKKPLKSPAHARRHVHIDSSDASSGDEAPAHPGRLARDSLSRDSMDGSITGMNDSLNGRLDRSRLPKMIRVDSLTAFRQQEEDAEPLGDGRPTPATPRQIVTKAIDL